MNDTAVSGPDEIIPAESVMTWHRNEAVKLRVQSTGHLSEKPISLPTLLLNASRKYADKTALGKIFPTDHIRINCQTCSILSQFTSLQTYSAYTRMSIQFNYHIVTNEVSSITHDLKISHTNRSDRLVFAIKVIMLCKSVQ